ncbi:hypothetical protein [Candidatus Uabimicrobium amorphum]|uniref:Uncharacterized protein n=1 Tax=Uabimicrobium amorphum TaxID=2596890 RepID=A0A5S9IV95_UABAM|nr:hypothetical protein [Candidatus Uabimicrobium amorphum]BBM87205.1 hypothetical protein UABAM_05608 [Candidatus Uabimicrobium amorphum]
MSYSMEDYTQNKLTLVKKNNHFPTITLLFLAICVIALPKMMNHIQENNIIPVAWHFSLWSLGLIPLGFARGIFLKDCYPRSIIFDNDSAKVIVTRGNDTAEIPYQYLEDFSLKNNEVYLNFLNGDAWIVHSATNETRVQNFYDTISQRVVLTNTSDNYSNNIDSTTAGDNVNICWKKGSNLASNLHIVLVLCGILGFIAFIPVADFFVGKIAICSFLGLITLLILFAGLGSLSTVYNLQISPKTFSLKYKGGFSDRNFDIDLENIVDFDFPTSLDGRNHVIMVQRKDQLNQAAEMAEVGDVNPMDIIRMATLPCAVDCSGLTVVAKLALSVTVIDALYAVGFYTREEK